MAIGRERVSLGAREETTLWWLVATPALTQPAEAKASNKEEQVLGMTRKSYLTLQGRLGWSSPPPTPGKGTS